jgi:MOSC domain-containing protein YiiM
MKLLSVNVGMPQEIGWRGEIVRTSIYKAPVAGRVCVRMLNVDGDQQSDLSVHGGRDKAVYAYPSEHYAFWRTKLPGMELSWGVFGENFSTEGLLEGDVNIGDRFRAGSAEFIVTQPRMPCFKLGIRFGRPDMVKRGITGADIVNLFTSDAKIQDLLRRASDLPALPQGWRDHFRKQLRQGT